MSVRFYNSLANTLGNVLKKGNTTEGTDIAITSGDAITGTGVIPLYAGSYIDIQGGGVTDFSQAYLYTDGGSNIVGYNSNADGNQLITDANGVRLLISQTIAGNTARRTFISNTSAGGFQIYSPLNEQITVQNTTGEGLLQYAVDPKTTTGWADRSIPDRKYVDDTAGASIQNLNDVLTEGNDTSGLDVDVSYGDATNFKTPSGKNVRIISFAGDWIGGSSTRTVTVPTPQSSGDTIAYQSYVQSQGILSQVLANGNTTGANNIDISNGQVINFLGATYDTAFNVTNSSGAADNEVTVTAAADGMYLTGEFGTTWELNLNDVSGAAFLKANGNGLYLKGSSFNPTIDASAATSAHTYTLPNKAGTLAVTSDVNAKPSFINVSTNFSHGSAGYTNVSNERIIFPGTAVCGGVSRISFVLATADGVGGAVRIIDRTNANAVICEITGETSTDTYNIATTTTITNLTTTQAVWEIQTKVESTETSVKYNGCSIQMDS